jgi:hypothetical protein
VIHLSRSSRRRHDTRTHAPSHVSTRPCTHARARASVHLGGEKPSPFSLCSSIELSSPAFRRGEPRRRPLWCRSTQWCERRVLLELTHPFSCMHARSLADTSHPSRAAETPFHRARALLAVVPCPLPNRGGRGGGIHACVAKHHPAHELALALARQDTAGNPSLAIVDTVSTTAPGVTLTFPRRSSSSRPRLFFP